MFPYTLAMAAEQRDYTRSSELGERLAALVPGGAHTYAKGADQYPELSPAVIERGRGCHVWDADGNEFIEYGMGLRAVGLGHAYGPVNDVVRASLELGTNFTRPAVIELECAERFVSMIQGVEMVKFTKDGSTATSGAVKLARKATGRDIVLICGDHPFFSYDDWFMSTTTADGGIPGDERSQSDHFWYNDLASLDAAFDRHPDAIAAVILEPVRTDPPSPGFLAGVRERCDRHGAVLVFDEMITGFRYHLHGATAEYGVTPDLTTFGKALANGFSLSALAGSRDLMTLGSRERDSDDVFLLSTTHGAETPGLAAAIATMNVYEAEPVIEHLHQQGEQLAAGLREIAARHGVADHVFPVGFACNLVFATRGPDGGPSQEFRTLFLQELIARGVIGPSLVVSYSHSDADVAATLDAIDGALAVYAAALESGVDRFLVGSPSRPVFDRHFH
jgi:glutamate-1-semialdehyde 2,1-aminomutase